LKVIRLTLPEPLDRLAVIVTALGDGRGDGRGETDAPQSVAQRYFDSFDWRLYRAGATLVHDGTHWQLLDLADGSVQTSQPGWSEAWPRFAGDFPADSALREMLGDLLDMRALIHLLSATGQHRTWRLLNHDGKTVLRGLAVELAAHRSPAATATVTYRWLELQPLRGYEEDADRAAARATELGCEPLGEPPLGGLLRATGLEPCGYSSRFTATLDPGMPARAAFAEISRILMHTARRNEAGVIADVDTEFLHDWRVAIRRQRSALTIFKGVLPPAATAAHAARFADLARLTGPLRDLDVYLLDEVRYRDRLPAPLQPGLDRLFDRARTQRTAELQRVTDGLAAPGYRQLLGEWLALLDGPDSGPGAEVPVLELARERLRRRWRRVLRDGRRIGPRSPDSALHRLRIQGKKLRYLLEFFASLFPRDDVAALVKQLKRMQDNLGAFNDLSVQRQRLEADLNRLLDRGTSGAALAEAAALGGLITALAAERKQVRKRFARTFAAFDSRDVGERFERLLDAEPRAAPPADRDEASA
jgi:CHAD domain-containing protein